MVIEHLGMFMFDPNFPLPVLFIPTAMYLIPTDCCRYEVYYDSNNRQGGDISPIEDYDPDGNTGDVSVGVRVEVTLYF